jgi:hypothetical protein
MATKDKTQNAQPATGTADETAQPATATAEETAQPVTAEQAVPDAQPAVRWEVTFTEPWPVDAASPVEAAWTALAERDEVLDGKGYTPDPNPVVWVRRAGTDDPWQPVDVG